MLLFLGPSYYFRSFWAVEKAENFTNTDVKYVDLNVLNNLNLQEWINNCNNSNPSHEYQVDISYWDTYRSDNDIFFSMLMEVVYKFVGKVGIKNFRTDKMNNKSFIAIIEGEDMRYFNNNWKTAKFIDLVDLNPHWNAYQFSLEFGKT